MKIKYNTIIMTFSIFRILMSNIGYFFYTLILLNIFCSIIFNMVDHSFNYTNLLIILFSHFLVWELFLKSFLSSHSHIKIALDEYIISIKARKKKYNLKKKKA